MIFHLKAAQNLIAEHYRRDFDMIFHLKLDTAQNLFGLQHERDFHMIFHFKKSQKISCRAQGNFDMNFLFMAPQILISEYYGILTWFSTWRQLKLCCRALWNRFWQDFPHYGCLKLGCGALWKLILTWYSTLWWLKTRLQSTLNFPL